MKVVISVPTYNTAPELLERAVTSLLKQTHEDIVVVVVNDGGEEPKLTASDSRLHLVSLPENRGRFFCDAVVTAALPTGPEVLWKPHDADDWAEPACVETLVAAARDGVAFAPYWHHRQDGTAKLVRPDARALKRPKPAYDFPVWHRLLATARDLGAPVPDLRWAPWRTGAHWCSGIYSVERVMRAGGIRPDFRVGYDSLFVRMVALTGAVGIAVDGVYHYDRTANEGSLTRSAMTGRASGPRMLATSKKIEINRQAYGAADPGAVVRSGVSPQTIEEVSVQTERLAQMLASR